MRVFIPSIKVGSSPRVRGADGHSALDPANVGIIPARAGSRARMLSITVCSWDHPRACGEQAVAVSVMDVQAGSSPRVRGAGQLADNPAGPVGIIPARAGSSLPNG